MFCWPEKSDQKTKSKTCVRESTLFNVAKSPSTELSISERIFDKWRGKKNYTIWKTRNPKFSFVTKKKRRKKKLGYCPFFVHVHFFTLALALPSSEKHLLKMCFLNSSRHTLLPPVKKFLYFQAEGMFFFFFFLSLVHHHILTVPGCSLSGYTFCVLLYKSVSTGIRIDRFSITRADQRKSLIFYLNADISFRFLFWPNNKKNKKAEGGLCGNIFNLEFRSHPHP